MTVVVDSVPVMPGATPRPASPGQGAAASGFGDALAALIAAASGTVGKTANAAADPDRSDAASIPTPAPDASAPLLAGLMPAAAPVGARQAAEAAPAPKASTALKVTSSPAGIEPPSPLAAAALATAAASPARVAQAQPEASQAAPAAGNDKPADEDARSLEEPATAPTAAPTAAVLAAALPVPAAAPAAPPASASAAVTAERSDAVAGGGGSARPSPQAASATPPQPAQAQATAAPLPPVASPAAPAAPAAPPIQGFAERIAMAAANGPATRPAPTARSATTAVAAPEAPGKTVTPSAAPAEAAVTPVAVAAVAAGDAQTGGEGSDQNPDAHGAPPAAAAGPVSTSSAAVAPQAAPPGGLDTVASFAAALVQRLGQRVSRFQVVLNPDGLGKVDVALHIGADGALSARIACDKKNGADALQARTGELAASLQQAGFSIAADSLRIDAPQAAAFGAGAFAGDASGGGGQERAATPSAAAWRSADADLDTGLDPAVAAYAIAGRARGLDIRI